MPSLEEEFMSLFAPSGSFKSGSISYGLGGGQPAPQVMAQVMPEVSQQVAAPVVVQPDAPLAPVQATSQPAQLYDYRTFNPVPYNENMLESEVNKIMQEYGLDQSRMHRAYSGWYQGAGLSKAETDAIRERVEKAAGYDPNLPGAGSFRAHIAAGLINPKQYAEAIRQSYEGRKNLYEAALESQRPLDSNYRQEFLDYATGVGPAPKPRLTYDNNEWQMRHLSRLEGRPENVDQVLSDIFEIENKAVPKWKRDYLFHQGATGLRSQMQEYAPRGAVPPLPSVNMSRSQLEDIYAGRVPGAQTANAPKSSAQENKNLLNQQFLISLLESMLNANRLRP
jgi:hypothetical protein